MPNPRLRYRRDKRKVGLSDAEQWLLTGQFYEDMNFFELQQLNSCLGLNLYRVRRLIDDYQNLIPDWRLPLLEELVDHQPTVADHRARTRARLRGEPLKPRISLLAIDLKKVWEEHSEAAVINGIDYRDEKFTFYQWLAALLAQQKLKRRRRR